MSLGPHFVGDHPDWEAEPTNPVRPKIQRNYLKMDVGAASATLVVVMVNHGRGPLCAGVPFPWSSLRVFQELLRSNLTGWSMPSRRHSGHGS